MKIGIKAEVFFSSILLAIVFSACTSNETKPLKSILIGDLELTPNSSLRVPMAAKLNFTSKNPVQAEITISGKSPITKKYSEYKTTHNISIIGLYPDTVNQVGVKLVDKKGHTYTGEVVIETPPLPSFFPEIKIQTLDRSKMEDGMHLFELLVPNGEKFDSYTIYFDDEGIIRWYLNMSETRRIAFTTLRMKNGNSMYVSWIDAIELNELGETIRQWKLGGYAGDHDIMELPNGNFLMGASKRNSIIFQDNIERKSRYDFAVELERETMNVVKEWDVRKVLDVDRTLLNDALGRDNYMDWFHINSVNYDKTDGSVLLSGRNQGVIKMNQSGNLDWIIAPHKGWGKSGINGDGNETSDFLLTAVDSKENPYPKEIQDGNSPAPDFEWAYGQHSVKLTEKGNILMFDNGYLRHFDKSPTYSRAVEYEIDEEAGTIKQVWQYGKELGLEMYSAITSDVDILPKTNNRLITAGYIRMSEDAPHAKMTEITYPDNKKVFEANIYFKNIASDSEIKWAKFDIVYRGERYNITH